MTWSTTTGGIDERALHDADRWMVFAETDVQDSENGDFDREARALAAIRAVGYALLALVALERGKYPRTDVDEA
jgi:hypothetical protein